MIANKTEVSQYLNPKKGDKLLDTVPVYYLVDIIDLYDLKVNKKEYFYV
jgi:hypothetical protein